VTKSRISSALTRLAYSQNTWIGPPILLALLCVSPAFAGTQTASTSSSTSADLQRLLDLNQVDSFDRISITGKPAARSRIAGSAHLLDHEKLEAFEYDDIHRILSEVPGVYVRGEDGYGLRPNIGLRGASSDRSAKLTLMEDGILLAPAPYSAPAAYYFPLTTRMTGVEVFKGPASIKYGPNTIGGALNLQTRAIPNAHTLGLDISGGMNKSLKLHSYWGQKKKNWAVLVEGIRLQTDGFKELDGGGDTGFSKNEFMAKARYNSDPAAETYHQLDIKLGYSVEASNETYLGLTDSDFKATPYRRYRASALGNMSWWRSQAQLRYSAATDKLDFQATLYRHDFKRDWLKLNHFRSGPSLTEILRFPETGQNRVYYSILTGTEDSTLEGQQLLIGSNLRAFVSQGVETVGRLRLDEVAGVEQEFEFGLRFHQDGVERNHSESAYGMEASNLVRSDADSEFTLKNSGESLALAAYVHEELRISKLLITLGTRLELIQTDFENRLTEKTINNRRFAVLPGVGAHYQVLEAVGVFAGVHRGFSPVAPGQSEEIQPEFSINYELGTRFAHGETRLELIGFFNDYSNLTSVCTLSSGCLLAQLSQQFNAGAVQVYGLEAALSHSLMLPFSIKLSGALSYTLTRSAFVDDLDDNPRFGDVVAGDELPYVPVQQANARIGLDKDEWKIGLAAHYVGEMRDVAGAGETPEDEKIASHYVLDALASYRLAKHYRLYLKVDNIGSMAYAVSRRPYGLRPGRPLEVFGGFKLEFGE
jgi:Fe(3+) dicitrate transport protein